MLIRRYITPLEPTPNFDNSPLNSSRPLSPPRSMMTPLRSLTQARPGKVSAWSRWAVANSSVLTTGSEPSQLAEGAMSE